MDSKETRHLWDLRSTPKRRKLPKNQQDTTSASAQPVERCCHRAPIRKNPYEIHRRCVPGFCRGPKNRTGPVSRARLLVPYPAGSQLRSSGRLGVPLLRAVTGTLHVLLSSPGISQSPTPNGPPAELQRFPGSGLRDGRSGPFRSPRFVMAGRSSRVCSATWSQDHCRASPSKVPGPGPAGGGDRRRGMQRR